MSTQVFEAAASGATGGARHSELGKGTARKTRAMQPARCAPAEASAEAHAKLQMQWRQAAAAAAAAAAAEAAPAAAAAAS